MLLRPLLLPWLSVYDVSKFADEHPGGDEVLLSEAGKDATESFEDVGHSDDARGLLPAMLVGDIEGGAVSVFFFWVQNQPARAECRVLTLYARFSIPLAAYSPSQRPHPFRHKHPLPTASE